MWMEEAVVPQINYIYIEREHFSDFTQGRPPSPEPHKESSIHHAQNPLYITKYLLLELKLLTVCMI